MKLLEVRGGFRLARGLIRRAKEQNAMDVLGLEVVVARNHVGLNAGIDCIDFLVPRERFLFLSPRQERARMKPLQRRTSALARAKGAASTKSVIASLSCALTYQTCGARPASAAVCMHMTGQAAPDARRTMRKT